MMTRRNIAVVGLSADPAHAAHVALSDTLHNAGLADEVWWLITPKNPLKDKAMASYAHRRQLAVLAVGSSRPWLAVSDFEVGVHIASEDNRTHTVLTDLTKVFPEYDFSFVMGSDNWLSLHTWGNWQLLTDVARLVVVPRRGYADGLDSCPAARTLPTERWDILARVDPRPEMSSTAIREALKTGKAAEGLNDAQLAYIRAHGLYGT